ncbi:MAG TPA: DUF1800 domain-containing protein [Vicinamibacterales bacterium]|jgi:uncharacterized protein (DUF1800 family)
MRQVSVIGLLAAALIAGGGGVSGRTAPFTRADLRWLGRVTFGVDSQIVGSYRKLGREKFLDAQLHPPKDDPGGLHAAIAALTISQKGADARVFEIRQENQRINALGSDEEKQKARMALNQAANLAVYETARRHLMRAIDSPWQLREEMTWFWMNHFSVFSGKGNVRYTLADYEEQAVRPHALGKFRDLVLATATSPAMLEYLDNAQSAANRINENYARELMELHTLGVSGGPSGSRYTQQDVQELARVLTGLGLAATPQPLKLGPQLAPLYVRQGLFEFNPSRHDRNTKTVLGEKIAGKGMDEVETAVTLLCRQPATARFISAKLATYFVADDPPPALVDRMARTFEKTDGDIAAVLRVMFLDKEFLAALADDAGGHRERATKFKDPMTFVVSSVRLAYEDKALTNYHPLVGWLQQLGEPLYGRVTPDGYPLGEAAWTSSGQMVRRFEIARAIGSGNAGLFNNEDNSPGTAAGFPMLTSRFYYDAIEPSLGPRTRAALGKSNSQQEWNTVLLASPDWMER